MVEAEAYTGRLNGFRCPWDIVQITSWLAYFLITGWSFFITGSERSGLSDSNAPLFLKIVFTIGTMTLTLLCAITDPTDQLYYLDWNCGDKLDKK